MKRRRADKDPLQDLVELSKKVSIGLPAEQLKKKSEKERLKDYLEKCS